MSTLPQSPEVQEEERLAPLMGPDYYTSVSRYRDRGDIASRLLTWHIGNTSLGPLLERHLPPHTAARINMLSALKLAYAAKHMGDLRNSLAAERRDKQEWSHFESDFSRFAAQKGNRFNILQIGANDGKNNDRVYPLAMGNPDWHITLVEPMNDAFSRLQQNYAGREHVELVQGAIVEEEGPVTMHYIVPDSVTWNYLDTVATTQPDTLSTFVQGNYQIGSTTVRGMRLESLASQTQAPLSEVDLMLVDAEGCDYSITKQALGTLGIRPAFLVAEHDHMSPREFKETTDLLTSSGYTATTLSHDLVARLIPTA